MSREARAIFGSIARLGPRDAMQKEDRRAGRAGARNRDDLGLDPAEIDCRLSGAPNRAHQATQAAVAAVDFQRYDYNAGWPRSSPVAGPRSSCRFFIGPSTNASWTSRSLRRGAIGSAGAVAPASGRHAHRVL